MNAVAKVLEEIKFDRVWGLYPDRKSRIDQLIKKIKPVVSFDGIPYYIKVVNPFRTSFLWEPSKQKKAKNLEYICDIDTYHTWAFYGFFKPTIAEVLAQIPEACLDKVIAFEIIWSPRDAKDLNNQLSVVREGYHRATTRLYCLNKDKTEGFWNKFIRFLIGE